MTLQDLGKCRDRAGEKHHRLTVVEFYGKSKNRKTIWKCICDCGNEAIVCSNNLVSGAVKSCGCYNIEKLKDRATHGMRGTKLYSVWNQMRQRCSNQNDQAYAHYGGRGISVCDEWLESSIFFEWAELNGYKPGLHIDRIDNNGNYEPGNCRFVSVAVNNQNKRTNKLDSDKVEQIRFMVSMGENRKSVAMQYEVSVSMVDRIIANKAWFDQEYTPPKTRRKNGAV